MESAEDLLVILKAETERRRVATKHLRLACLGAALFLLLVEVVLSIRRGRFETFPVGLFFLAATLVAGASGKLKLATKQAAQLSDKRMTGPLIEVLDCGDKEVVTLARECLIELLPRIDEQDSDLLDSTQRAKLAQLAKTDADPELAARAIGALRYVGRGADLLALDSIAQGTTKVPKAKREHVAELARMASVDLRIRLSRSLIEGQQTAVLADTEQIRNRLPGST